MASIDSRVGSIWIKKKKVIAASATETVDTAVFATMQALKYIIVVYNESEDKRKYVEMGIIKDGADIKSSTHGIIVGGASITIAESVAAGLFSLKITNNNSFVITSSLAKLLLT